MTIAKTPKIPDRVSDKDRSVVKSNRLNSADYNLELQEVRLVQLGIIRARETGHGFSLETPIRVHASDFADIFGMTRRSAYLALRQTADQLMGRMFYFVDRNDGNPVKAHWLQRCKYLEDQGAVEFVFTQDVEQEIMRLDGKERFFTEYVLSQTARMRSLYSLRLYELTIQWRSKGFTPIFDLKVFRRQMSVPDASYAQFSDFRRRVLEPAIKDVREHAKMHLEYKTIKSGRVVTGLQFSMAVIGTDKVAEKIEDVVNVVRSVAADVAIGQNRPLVLESSPAAVEEVAQEADVEQVPVTVEADQDSGWLLTEPQAYLFARKLLNDSGFTATLPQTLKNKQEGISYLVKRFTQEPEYVRRHLKRLQKHGFGAKGG